MVVVVVAKVVRGEGAGGGDDGSCGGEIGEKSSDRNEGAREG